MDGHGADDARVVIDKYLPELDSEDVREALVEHLVAVPADIPADEGEFPPPPDYDPGADGEGGMRDYYAHWTRAWSDGLAARIAASPQVAPGAGIAAGFIADQTERTGAAMVRVLLEELYRLRSSGGLDGATAEERYRSFRHWTNSPDGHRHLLGRYPHLFRSCRAQVQAAADHLLAIIGEVERNRAALDRGMPGVREGSRITSVRLGRGDTHNGGLSVAEIGFDDGGRILYKPRPVQAERGYNAFVDWLNRRMGAALPTVRYLPADAGGFSAFVATGPFSGTAEEYYGALGRLAGVLYLVKGVDIHFENLLSSPAGPTVIDAETLFAPRWRIPETADSAWMSAGRRLNESVACTGLLPMVMRRPGADSGMHVGVVGYEAGQQAPYRALRVRNRGRDDMHTELATATASGPGGDTAEGVDEPSPAAQRDTIKRELRRVLEFAARHRSEVADAVEEHLADARFRYVAEPTAFYAQLLRMARHPEAVADPLVRAALLHRVALTKGAVDDLTRAEAAQLAAGDVPYFSYTGRSTALEADGAVVRADAFEEPPAATVRDRILALDEKEIEHQLHMVDLAFVARLPLDKETTGFAPAASGRRAPAAPVGRSRLLAEAVRIGDDLVASVIHGDDADSPATWIAPQIATLDDLQWSPGVLGPDLYSGSSGAALVLAGLAHATGRRDFRDTALAVLDPLERGFADDGPGGLPSPPGAYGGIAGVAYALATARRLLGDDSGAGSGDLAEAIARTLDGCTEPDLVGGAAGALAVLLSLHRNCADARERKRIARAARRAADTELRLLADTGPDGRATGHTGYAHGTIGIAPYLLEYAAVFGDERARETGLLLAHGIAAAQDPDDRDWPREWGGDERSYAWCHGAPGLLLGALQVGRHAPDAIPEDRIARMAELTLTRGFGNNPSYCHGDLGSAETVLFAARERPDLFPAGTADGLYEHLFDAVLERYPSRWDTRYTYSRSLMLGRPGTAWSILRRLEPEAFPSLLRLD
ncbi:type 2 lanthipeptide synthetase LanM family protein [Nocardiopsis sp. RSe5-2]|uniref:Type 2 lanthipeptide synthetase LanM family protein n=1 Tax=Nocardiopsis endophytica TaxID=3018445 RepID=A0ABT4U525_9ACTN|nr:type 2 lanthipeptide synthetase LanM family protein [Nocardiopsis endophytica]MDA2811550.1 type 2 lanthipeptide synthetase LanM family protein [Nocardiopsis endophytica]